MSELVTSPAPHLPPLSACLLTHSDTHSQTVSLTISPTHSKVSHCQSLLATVSHCRQPSFTFLRSPSFGRSFVCSFVRSVAFIRSFDCSFVRLFVLSFVAFVRSFFDSFAFVRSFVCSIVCSFACLLRSWFVGVLICSFVRLLQPLCPPFFYAFVPLCAALCALFHGFTCNVNEWVRSKAECALRAFVWRCQLQIAEKWSETPCACRHTRIGHSDRAASA